MYVLVVNHAAGMMSSFSYVCRNIFFCSQYGLTKHKEVCTRPALNNPAIILFTCRDCTQTFTEKRYLLQHAGSKKCAKKKAVLDKTASFSLALSESPASSSATRSRGPVSLTPTFELFISFEYFADNLQLLLQNLQQSKWPCQTP